MSEATTQAAGPRLRGPWLIAWVAATVLSLLLAIQNLPVVQQAGLDLGLWGLFLRELVVWYSWLTLLPLVWLLTRRFPVSGAHRWRNLSIHALAAPLVVAVVVLLFTAIRMALFGDLMPQTGFAEAVVIVYRRFFAFFLFVYAGAVAAFQAWWQGMERREQELAQVRLQAMLQESRLENLRSQLDPHFLFNALNAISSLVAREPTRARQMIARLSGLLRMSLGQDGKGLIPLSEELQLLGVYLEIQQLRFGDDLQVALEIDDEAEHALLPRLLLQPLVENAVHHGIEQRAEAGRIDIRIEVHEDRLGISVEDDGPGFGADVQERVGLGNARARLELHYGDAAQLDYTNRSDGGARVTVSLPWQAPAQEDP